MNAMVAGAAQARALAARADAGPAGGRDNTALLLDYKGEVVTRWCSTNTRSAGRSCTKPWRASASSALVTRLAWYTTVDGYLTAQPARFGPHPVPRWKPDSMALGVPRWSSRIPDFLLTAHRTNRRFRSSARTRPAGQLQSCLRCDETHRNSGIHGAYLLLWTTRRASCFTRSRCATARRAIHFMRTGADGAPVTGLPAWPGVRLVAGPTDAARLLPSPQPAKGAGRFACGGGWVGSLTLTGDRPSRPR